MDNQGKMTIDSCLKLHTKIVGHIFMLTKPRLDQITDARMQAYRKKDWPIYREAIIKAEHLGKSFFQEETLYALEQIKLTPESYFMVAQQAMSDPTVKDMIESNISKIMMDLDPPSKDIDREKALKLNVSILKFEFDLLDKMKAKAQGEIDFER